MVNRTKNELNFRNDEVKGKLITFCGMDGSGKTTMINMLNEYLTDRGISTVLTKQPTEFIRKSEIFRNIIDKPDHTGYDFVGLTLLAAGDRLQHANGVILPAMKKGYTVISDRYFYSCLANYRVSGYGMDEWIYEIVKYLPKPDHAFFMDTDVNVAVCRIRNRKEERDRYIDIEFQRKLRKEYLRIARENNGTVVSSSLSIEESFEIIKRSMEHEIL